MTDIERIAELERKVAALEVEAQERRGEEIKAESETVDHTSANSVNHDNQQDSGSVCPFDLYIPPPEYNIVLLSHRIDTLEKWARSAGAPIPYFPESDDDNFQSP